MKKFYRSVILLTVLLALSLIITLSADDVFARKKVSVGDTIPDFALPNGITGEKVSFNANIKNRSKLIAITFMTTTCSACKKEMTLLSDLANDYTDDLKVYAISVDFNGEKTIPAYDKNFGFNVSSYMLDPDFRVPHLFGFSFTPSLVIAAGNGTILFVKGGFSEDVYDEIVDVIKDAIR